MTACRLTGPAIRAMLGLLAAIRLAESAAQTRLKPMTRINLPGGYIEIIAFFRDHKGKRSTMYRAVSAHTREAIECFSMSKAQFFIRSTHEEYTVLMRGV